MKYLKHKITAGERIDQIALKYYGNATQVEDIYKTNRWLTFNSVLTDYAGETLYIPIEENTEETTAITTGLRVIYE